MPRRPACVTQADIARAIRAARQEGAAAVRILPGGTILIDMQAPNAVDPQQIKIAPEEEIVL